MDSQPTVKDLQTILDEVRFEQEGAYFFTLEHSIKNDIEVTIPAKSLKLFAERYAAHLVQQAKDAAFKWISVEEKLPKDHKDVLAIIENNGTSLYIEQTCYYNNRWETDNIVSHWIYLNDVPEPYTTGEKGGEDE